MPQSRFTSIFRVSYISPWTFPLPDIPPNPNHKLNPKSNSNPNTKPTNSNLNPTGPTLALALLTSLLTLTVTKQGRGYVRGELSRGTVLFPVFMPSTRQWRRRYYVFRLSVRRVCSSVRPDRSCYHDISWTAWAISIKHTRNIQQPLLMTWLDSGGQRSKVTVGLRQDVDVAKASTST